MSTAEHWFEYSFCVGKRVEVCWTNCCADAHGAIAAASSAAGRAVRGVDRAICPPNIARDRAAPKHRDPRMAPNVRGKCSPATFSINEH